MGRLTFPGKDMVLEWPIFHPQLTDLAGISIMDSGRTKNIHTVAPKCNRHPGSQRSEPPVDSSAHRGWDQRDSEEKQTNG